MKVLLVQAYLGSNAPPVFPLGLACIASTITHHETKVFDPNAVDNPFTSLEETCSEFNPDVVGISLRNIDSTNKSEIVFYYQWINDVITAIVSRCSAKIVVGGSGFSMFAREIMEQETSIDFGVYLEGEQVFSQLLDNLDTPHKVPSIFYRRGDEIHFSGNSEPQDVNETPVPSWAVLPLAPYLKGRDSIGVETKRGCALSCIYCIYGFLNGQQYRLKQPKRVVDEIEVLTKNHGVKHFTFVDSIFNVPLPHAQAICREMVDRGLEVTWSAWFNEHFMDQEFISLVEQSGCNHIIFSPDGFSDKVLQKLGKNLSNKDIVRSFKLLRKNNHVDVTYNFFRNPPGQNIANFAGMLFFCLRAKLILKKRVHFEFSTLRIEPHTKLYSIALEEGVISDQQSLLAPTYYNNRSTRYLERPFSFLLSLVGK